MARTASSLTGWSMMPAAAALDLTGQPEVEPEVEAEGLDDRIAEVRTIGPFEGMLGVAIGVEGNVLPEYEISKDGTAMVIEVSEPESQDEPTEL
ncbi:hypothetical protein [Streptomyces spiramenti]|uniref:hypothetical protein n=1 Tax=Streptomyces spiramenti TaxID=2720606 RepID=UPI001ADD7FE2|nr:hypothetical protein [Streptomyces spiramenti]